MDRSRSETRSSSSRRRGPDAGEPDADEAHAAPLQQPGDLQLKRASLRLRSLVLTAGVVVAALPATPAHAATVTTKYFVPTVGGSIIRVEVTRNTSFDPQPVILTYSPYNNLNGATPSTAGAGAYNSKGIARASADVLGTRGSTGCWDYGGLFEQQSGVDVVKFLAGKIPDVDGNNHVVERQRRDDRHVLRRHDRQHGRRHGHPRAEGDRPGRRDQPLVRLRLLRRCPVRSATPARRPTRASTLRSRSTTASTAPFPKTTPRMVAAPGRQVREQESLAHTQQGYSRIPNYTQLLAGARLPQGRVQVPRRRPGRPRLAGLQRQAGRGRLAVRGAPRRRPADRRDVVEGVPFKMLVTEPGAPRRRPRPSSTRSYDRFWAQTLKGVDNGVELEPPVQTLGRTSAGAATGVHGGDRVAAGRHDQRAPVPRPQASTRIPGVPSVGPAGTTGENGVLSHAPRRHRIGLDSPQPRDGQRGADARGPDEPRDGGAERPGRPRPRLRLAVPGVSAADPGRRASRAARCSTRG